MIVKSIFSGFKSAMKNKRMVALFYLANLSFALVVMLPFRFLLDKIIGNSTMGENLAGGIDFNFVFELIINNPAGLSWMNGLIILVPILFWLCGLFLSGGAFSTFIGHRRFEAAHFWGESGKYFWRFVRLFLLAIPVFILFYSVQFLETAARYIIYGDDPYQSVVY